jgi:hypothetical protein
VRLLLELHQTYSFLFTLLAFGKAPQRAVAKTLDQAAADSPWNPGRGGGNSFTVNSGQSSVVSEFKQASSLKLIPDPYSLFTQPELAQRLLPQQAQLPERAQPPAQAQEPQLEPVRPQ